MEIAIDIELLTQHRQAINSSSQGGEEAAGAVVSKLLVFRHRRGTDATKCGLDVLALHCRDHVRGRKIVGGQSLGIEPQPQRLIERPAPL
jgi:hypothetical protein